MEITTKIVITRDGTRENDTLECILFIFERYKERHVIGCVLVKLDVETQLIEIDNKYACTTHSFHFENQKQDIHELRFALTLDHIMNLNYKSMSEKSDS